MYTCRASVKRSSIEHYRTLQLTKVVDFKSTKSTPGMCKSYCQLQLPNPLTKTFQAESNS